MELRHFWNIIRRRLWLVIFLPLLVVGFSLATRRPAPPVYSVSLAVIVDVPPLPIREGLNFDPRFTAPQATEYLVDDFSELVRRDAFAQAVSRRLAAQGIQIPAGAIQGSTSSEKRHRIMTLAFNWNNPDQAQAIAQAIVATLTEDSPQFFARLAGVSPQVTLIDGPNVAAVAPSLRDRLDLPLRLALSLAVALGIVFLWHYLDDRLYSSQELQSLGLAVLGEIPQANRQWRLWDQRAGGRTRR
ncbi:MAG: hypothetical protein HY326_00835 [Chloroflexi bacterium]|nr:hypothetical protein [Chloroflexota bacterium]